MGQKDLFPLWDGSVELAQTLMMSPGSSGLKGAEESLGYPYSPIDSLFDGGPAMELCMEFPNHLIVKGMSKGLHQSWSRFKV